MKQDSNNPLGDATCCASDFVWGDDKPFNAVWKRLNTGGEDPIGDKMIKEGMEAAWRKTGAKTYEVPPVAS